MDASDVKRLLWPWLFLPLTALDWWIAWRRVPERVVMKFGSNGQPVSWATREQALEFDLLLVGGVLAFSTVVVFLAGMAQPEKAGKAYAGLAVTNTLIFLVTNAILWIVQVRS